MYSKVFFLKQTYILANKRCTKCIILVLKVHWWYSTLIHTAQFRYSDHILSIQNVPFYCICLSQFKFNYYLDHFCQSRGEALLAELDCIAKNSDTVIVNHYISSLLKEDFSLMFLVELEGLVSGKSAHFHPGHLET